MPYKDKAKRNAATRAWKAANRADLKKENARYYQEHKGMIAVKHAAWADANASLMRAYRRKWIGKKVKALVETGVPLKMARRRAKRGT